MFYAEEFPIDDFHDRLWDAYLHARLVANHDPAKGLKGFYRELANLKWEHNSTEKRLPAGQLYFHITDWVRDKDLLHAKRDFAAAFNGDKLHELHQTHANAVAGVESFTDDQADGCSELATHLIALLDDIRSKHLEAMNKYETDLAAWREEDPYGAKVGPWQATRLCNNNCPICSECNNCCSRDINSNWYRVETRNSGLGGVACHPRCSQYNSQAHKDARARWEQDKPTEPGPPTYPPIQIGACINCPITNVINGENDLMNKIHQVTNCHADVKQSMTNTYVYHPLTDDEISKTINNDGGYGDGQDQNNTTSTGGDADQGLMAKINKPITEGSPVTWLHVLIILILIVVAAAFWPQGKQQPKSAQSNPWGPVYAPPPS